MTSFIYGTWGTEHYFFLQRTEQQLFKSEESAKKWFVDKYKTWWDGTIRAEDKSYYTLNKIDLENLV